MSEKAGTGGCAQAEHVGLAGQLGNWKLAGCARGGTGHSQSGHMCTSPGLAIPCHYLFRPPVEGSPKLGLVSAAVVVASKIVLSRGSASLGHPSNKCGGGTPRTYIPAP